MLKYMIKCPYQGLKQQGSSSNSSPRSQDASTAAPLESARWPRSKTRAEDKPGRAPPSAAAPYPICRPQGSPLLPTTNTLPFLDSFSLKAQDRSITESGRIRSESGARKPRRAGRSLRCRRGKG